MLSYIIFAISQHRKNHNFINVKLFGILILAFLLSFQSVLAQETLDELQSRAKVYKSKGDLNMEAYCYNKLAYLEWDNARNNSAIDYFLQSLDINTRKANKNAIREINSNIGMIYAESGNHQKAVEYLSKALQISVSQKNDQSSVSLYINLSSSLQELGNHQEAIENLKKASELAAGIQDKSLLMNASGMLAQSYEALGNSEETMKYYNLFINLDRQVKMERIKDIQAQTSRQIELVNAERMKAEKELSIKTTELKVTLDSLEYAEEINKHKQTMLELNHLKMQEKDSQLRIERLIRYSLIGLFLLFIFLGLLILRQYHFIRKKNVQLAEKNEKIQRQNQQISDSISYAQTIQQAILPELSTIEEHFENFVLYLPKDVISGDFYWFSHHNTKDGPISIIAAVDCTGHGVPGAFMSLIGSRLISEIIALDHIYSPAEILNALNDRIIEALNQKHTHNRDGMDVSIITVYHHKDKTDKIIFAGSKRPLYYFHNDYGKVDVIEGTSKSIGGKTIEEAGIHYINNTLFTEKGDMVYLTSDGIIDQACKDRKRYGTPRLTAFMEKHGKDSIHSQGDNLLANLKEHMQDAEQRDDILVIGIRL